MAQRFTTGKHVWYVGGAGEEAVLAHFVKHNGDGTDKIQVPGGGTENVPRREPDAGEYDPAGKQDLGKTWHTIRADD